MTSLRGYVIKIQNFDPIKRSALAQSIMMTKKRRRMDRRGQFLLTLWGRPSPHPLLIVPKFQISIQFDRTQLRYAFFDF